MNCCYADTAVNIVLYFHKKGPHGMPSLSHAIVTIAQLECLAVAFAFPSAAVQLNGAMAPLITV